MLHCLVIHIDLYQDKGTFNTACSITFFYPLFLHLGSFSVNDTEIRLYMVILHVKCRDAIYQDNHAYFSPFKISYCSFSCFLIQEWHGSVLFYCTSVFSMSSSTAGPNSNHPGCSFFHIISIRVYSMCFHSFGIWTLFWLTLHPFHGVLGMVSAFSQTESFCCPVNTFVFSFNK